MKYALRFKWVLALILGGLLISTVLATGGAYGLFWSVDNGGAIFSSGGSYSLGGTIGQPDAGRLSGGRYVLGGGFFGGGARVPSSHAVYLPLLRNPPPFFCDSYEPNDDRFSNAWGPLASGQPYEARICAGDQEDNYYFITSTGNAVQIALTLPQNFVHRFTLSIYAQNGANPLPGAGCYVNPVGTASYNNPCVIPGPGRYIVRLYTDPGLFDNINPYTLRVTYQ